MPSLVVTASPMHSCHVYIEDMTALPITDAGSTLATTPPMRTLPFFSRREEGSGRISENPGISQPQPLMMLAGAFFAVPSAAEKAIDSCSTFTMNSCSSPTAIPSAPPTGDIHERTFQGKITDIKGMEEEGRDEEEEEEQQEILDVDLNVTGPKVWHEVVAKQTPHPLKKG